MLFFCLLRDCSLCVDSPVEVGKVEISKVELDGLRGKDERAMEEEFGEGKCGIEVKGYENMSNKVVSKAKLY